MAKNEHFVRVFGQNNSYLEGIFCPRLSNDERIAINLLGSPIIVAVRWEKTLKVSYIPIDNIEDSLEHK